MAETGLSFRFPAGATVKASDDGELKFTAGNELFVMMEAVDSIDQAMKSGIARMKAIDKEAKEVKSTERDQGGIKQKATRGTMKVDGDAAQWVVLAFNGGKKTLKVVLMVKDLENNPQALELVGSIKK